MSNFNHPLDSTNTVLRMTVVIPRIKRMELMTTRDCYYLVVHSVQFGGNISGNQRC